MRIKEILLMVGIILLIMGSTLGVIESVGEYSKINDFSLSGKYTSHGVIRINGNAEFIQTAQQEGWQGNGSEENPYIISDYDIDIGDNPAGIEIHNTTLYFIVKNCYLHHSTYFFGGYGIRFENVSNGYVANTITENNENGGIYIENSRNITVDNCTFENTPDEYGMVEIHNSMNIIVDNCTISSDNMYGIYITNSQNLLIKYNKISNMRYMSIYLFNITNSSFIKNDVNYVVTNIGGWGINMEHSNYNYFSENNIYYGSGVDGVGITLSNSDFNKFSGNNIHNGKYGILLKSSDNNIFTNNYIHNNSQCGIYISSGIHNRIYLNRFCYNNGAGNTYNGNSQAYDNGTQNYWNSSSGYGNYWLDWANNNDTNDGDNDGIVDWPYIIDGNGSSTYRDYYPLKNYPPPLPEISINLVVIPLAVFLLLVKFRKKK